MNDEFERLFTMYDGGHLNRRQLLQGLLGLGLGSGVVSTRSDASASDGLREPLFHAHTINHVTIRAADVPRSIAMWLRMHRLTPRWRRRTGERGGSSRDRWADFQHSSTGERRWSWHGVPAVRRHQGQTGKQNQRGGNSRLVRVVRGGAILAGLASTRYYGPLATSTNAGGTYRFLALPPAEYTLVFSRQGFVTRRHSAVVVALGATTTADAVMVAGLAQDVTVLGAPPLLDRNSASVKIRFDGSQLANLPGARNMGAVLSATPAVQLARFDVGAAPV